MTRGLLYRAEELKIFASALLLKAGLNSEKAGVVAGILLEGDLLGHSTHGLQLLAAYLNELEKGRMTKEGDPEVIADFPAVVTWDGRRLPGPWLIVKAIDLATERAAKNGTATLVIRRSHHIACLAAYLQRVTEKGMMAILSCSDPTVAGVAPYGGRKSLYTPNPIAAAWPTGEGPVIMDISQSITSLGYVKRLAGEGRKLPGVWALDAEGHPTDDPAAVLANPAGSLLPTGGMDHGHKGYALALLVEALTGGLAGNGRADPSEGWTATVFLQVLDPALFAGREAFFRETTWVAEACHANPTVPGVDRVRLPGEAGLKRRERQLKDGVELYPSIAPSLEPWAKKWGVAFPKSL